MLITFDTAAKLISEGKLLHIAGTEGLLKKLPKGNWVGGSTEYFMASEGKISDELLFVNEFPYKNFSIKTYDEKNISNVTADAFYNGFSILILPYDSEIHESYALNSADYKDMFIKKIAGWVSCMNTSKPEQQPITINGVTGEISSEKGVALHMETPADKKVSIDIINIFEQDENSPTFEFMEDGFQIKNCLIDGKEGSFAEYIAKNNVDTRLPLVGNYSGNGINISYKSTENGVVNTVGPVVSGVKYKIAKPVPDYVKEFQVRLAKHKDTKAVFSCNCWHNFLYGELEGKSFDSFTGPITFGEIAYQLLNQTLVYVTVE